MSFTFGFILGLILLVGGLALGIIGIVCYFETRTSYGGVSDKVLSIVLGSLALFFGVLFMALGIIVYGGMM